MSFCETIADWARWSLSKFSASIVSEVGFQGFEDKQDELGFAAQVAHLTGIYCRTSTSVKLVFRLLCRRKRGTIMRDDGKNLECGSCDLFSIIPEDLLMSAKRSLRRGSAQSLQH